MTALFPIQQYCATEAELHHFAAGLAQLVEAGTVIFLSGPLGAGKTTFTRGFLHSLGYHQKVKSPTYTLIEPYEIAGKKLFHVDLYRLQHPKEVLHIGLQDYLYPEAICLIEWPEKGVPFLPQADLVCTISFRNPGRMLDLKAQSAKGEKMVLNFLNI